MIRIFMRSPLPNGLAVVVLAALVVTLVISIIMSLREEPVDTDGGWYSSLLPAFSLLGLPAALDLLQTSGITMLFAAAVLLVFLLNIAAPVLKMLRRSSQPWVTDWYTWSIPAAAIGGLLVAGYLTFVEATGSQVSCGPSGGCQAVQSSRFAVLYGVLPVGTLGLAGYVAILAAWIAWRAGPTRVRKIASLAMWGLCLFGTLFEIYLTFLEPFVIGATCMWCLSSAVLMVILLLVTTPFAQQALAYQED